jgi:hypothetical protein
MTNDNSLYDHAREQLREAGRAAKDKAASYAEGEKSRVSHQLEEFATAVEKAGDQLRKDDHTLSAELLSRTGDSLSAFSRSMGEASLPEIADSVRRFGRESPTAFIGGAVLVGLAIGRFARASGDRAHRRDASRAPMSPTFAGGAATSPPSSAELGDAERASPTTTSGGGLP